MNYRDNLVKHSKLKLEVEMKSKERNYRMKQKIKEHNLEIFKKQKICQLSLPNFKAKAQDQV